MLAMIPAYLLSAPTDFAGVEANLLPLVFAALLLDVCIVAIWYFLGVVLQNDSVRESAKGEYYQFLGTAFLVVLLVWGITAYSGLAYAIMGSTKLMSPSAISTLCTNVENSQTLNIIGPSDSLLSGAQTPSGTQLVGICDMLDNNTLTDAINYPLAAAAVVTANLTAQTANNINGAYTYDAYIGFLSKLTPQVSLCFAEPPPAIQCLVPGGALIGAYYKVTLSYAPYAGFSMLYSDMGSLGSLLQLSFEAYIAQLLLISIILFIWPYLLFGGIVLRATFFTRRIGGLLIAIAIGAVVVFPTVFAIEYTVLGNGLPGISAISPLNSTYGFNALSPNNAIPPIPGAINATTGLPSNYITNFYVQPSMQDIAMANNCWPAISTTKTVSALLGGVILGPVGSVAGIAAAGNTSSTPVPLGEAELADIFYLLNPVTNIAGGVGQLLSAATTASSGTFFLPAYCPYAGAAATTLEMVNSYGVIGVTSYFLPIINLIITLSAIIGMSGLMGGDTTLEGLSRFV